MRFRISLFLAICALFAIATAENPPILNGSECDQGIGPLAQNVSPVPPAEWYLDYIGLPEQFGTSYYDYQHNGSMSRMIAVGADGSIHCCWTNGLNSGASQRVIYYNKKLSTGTWVHGSTGLQVNSVTRAGFCTLDLDPAGDPVIAYHGYMTATPNLGFIWNLTGEHALPAAPVGVVEIAWPHVTVDNRGYIHVIAMGNNPSGTVTGKVYYSRSQDGGVSWTAWQMVDSLGTAAAVSQTAASDPVSGKVALAWVKPLNNNVLQGEIYYVESTDGVTWNFANKINLTGFSTMTHPAAANSRCYDDVSLMYDHSGNLRAAYTTVQYPTSTNGGKIWHWSLATGHRFITGTYVADAWTALNTPGGWRRSIDRPTLGENAAGTLYVQWGQCTTPGDVSQGNRGNWDVWATYSTNGGHDWKAPVNVTETASPGAPPGSCLSENWANMAKKVTDKLNIQYIEDLDAGGAPLTEGTWTLNPVIYQGVPVDSILTGLTVDLTPTGSTTVPPGGGSIPYTASVQNTGNRPLHIDVWIDIQLPNQSLQAILQRLALTLPVGGTITRSLSQSIPGSAPPGQYSLRGHAGVYGWNAWAEDSFPFTKTGMDASAGGSWATSGWDEVEESTPITVPVEQNLVSIAPNPFNPTTAISYELRTASFVNLKVYDTAGRLVTELVNGSREAGTHQVTFDGSHLASGIYLYNLTAGQDHAVGKMVLLK